MHAATLDDADDLTERTEELAEETEDCDREERDEELGGVHGDVEHWFVPGPMTAKQVLPKHSACVASTDELLLAVGTEDAFDELREELCEEGCEDREERPSELFDSDDADEAVEESEDDTGFSLQLAVQVAVA